MQNENFSEKSLQKFLELTRKPKVIYTDNSLEFGNSCAGLSWNHCTSTPHRSETSGIAERAVRRIKEWTSAVLLQSGLDEKWWADSMECYCYLQNIQDLMCDGQTPYERRFGKPMSGPAYSVWSNDRISPYFCSRPIEITSVWFKSLPSYIPWTRVFRGENLKGDIMVEDIEELEEMDASELHALNAKEVLTPMKGEHFTFPVADGTVKTLWRR